jgi:hypothetical protein
LGNENIKIKFELADVYNKFLFHLKETIDCLTHIYYAIDKFDIDIHKPLPTDSFPIVINDKKSKPTIDEQRQITLNWTLTKAFEDLINGLTKSFKETYRYLRIYSLYKASPLVMSRDEFEKKLNKIEMEIDKLHFPDFIERIENNLSLLLPLKEEILSINKIRNCLVHRDGVVEDTDIKNSMTNSLHLKWISLKFWTTVAGKQTEITYDLRKDGVTVTDINYETTNNEKVFKLKDKISLNINEFNGIAYTCSTFAQNLFQVLPRPE